MTSVKQGPSGVGVESREARQDLINQQEFMSFVDGLRASDVSEMPNLAEQVNHQTRRTSGLDVVLDGGGDRAFITPEFTESLGSSRFPDRIEFTPQELLRMGRDNSFQQVFFGALTASWFHEAEDETVQVAVKPIQDQFLTEDRVLHEAAMYQYLGQLGIPAVKLAGVGLFERPRHKVAGYEITSFDPELFTLDNVNWEHNTEERVEEYIDYALDTMAVMHSNLVFHGDMEFKNVGLTTATGSIQVVDVEFATSARDVPENINRIAQQMSHDFSCLGKSFDNLVFKNYDEDKKPADDIERFNILHNLVFEPYFERLIQIKSPYLDVLAKAYDEVIRQKVMQARGEW